MRPSPVAGCLLFAVACAAAPVDAADEPLRLPDLRVSGKRLADAASVSVVDSDEVLAGLGLSLDAALAGVPGVFAQNSSNFAQGLRIAIRGFGSRAAFGVRGIRVLVDGVPLTLADGQTELDAIDLSLVEAVHVNRGAAAAQFGNAAGGVISIRTRPPPREPEWRIGSLAGEHGALKLRAETGGALGGAHWLGALSRSQLDGHREHAEYRSSLLNLKSSLPLQASELRFDVSALDVSARDPGGLNRSQRNADPQQAAPNNLRFDAGETIAQQRLAAQWLFGTDEALSLSGFVGQRRFANRLPFESGGQVRLQRRFGGAGLAAGVEGKWLGRPQRLDAGADLQWQADRRERFDNLDGRRGDRVLFQDETATGVGIYLQHAVALGRGWALRSALRHDWLRLAADDRQLDDGDASGTRRFADPAASLALSWQALPAMQGFLRLASAYESPTQTELANPNGGGFNPALEAARSLGVELGLSGGRGRLSWQAVAYRIDVRDELIPFEDANQPGRTFFRNAGSSRRDGLELSLLARPTASWELGLAATLGDYRFRDYVVDGDDRSGNRLPGVPARHARVHSGWQFEGIGLRLDWELVGERQANDANTESAAGYGLLHLRADGLVAGSRLRWQLGLRNLLDRDHDDNLRINAFGGRHFEPAAGRSVFAGIEWRSGGDA